MGQALRIADALEEELEFGSERFRIRSVQDVDRLYDRLMQLPPGHPDLLDERIPYWAELWPSAIGMAEWIAKNQWVVAGKEVLEIGCGLGLPGIVAARHAKHVCLTDYLEEPLQWADMNWKLNRSDAADVRVLDWREPAGVNPVQVLLASDVAYEKRMFAPLLSSMERLLKPGGIAVLSEPGRALASEFFKGLDVSGFIRTVEEVGVRRKEIPYKVRVHVIRKKTSVQEGTDGNSEGDQR